MMLIRISFFQSTVHDQQDDRIGNGQAHKEFVAGQTMKGRLATSRTVLFRRPYATGWMRCERKHDGIASAILYKEPRILIVGLEERRSLLASKRVVLLSSVAMVNDVRFVADSRAYYSKGRAKASSINRDTIKTKLILNKLYQNSQYTQIDMT